METTSAWSPLKLKSVICLLQAKIVLFDFTWATFAGQKCVIFEDIEIQKLPEENKTNLMKEINFLSHPTGEFFLLFSSYSIVIFVF